MKRAIGIGKEMLAVSLGAFALALCPALVGPARAENVSMEGLAQEAPRAAISCIPVPSGSSSGGFRPMAYEVNGVSYCSGTGRQWKITIPNGQKVKIRYALRDDLTNLNQACSTSDSLFLYLDALAMGVVRSYLTRQGQWVASFDYFRNAPPRDVWNDLYDDYPPKGFYELDMGCDDPAKGSRYGGIQFDIQ